MPRSLKSISDINVRRHDAPALGRVLLALVFGLALSGCVATALTPGPDVVSPILSLGQTDGNPQSDATGVPSLVGETANQPGGIAIPSPRPGATAARQLALADSTEVPVAAQKAAKLAIGDGQAAKPKNSEKPAEKKATYSSDTEAGNTATAPAQQPVAKPKNNFFASLFQPGGNTKKRKKRNNNKPAKKRQVAVFRASGSDSLPGVRKLGLFGIFEVKEGEHEGYGNPILMASAGGLARTSPNGLRIQHAGVQVACLQPGVVRIIKKVQRHYGRVPIITSGYRSPRRNRRARGARNSMHIHCMAADIQVVGVSKWALAKYLRSIPGRGGVGTYCHTKSVHIDIGSKRDWNWRCRRGKRRKKSRS